MTPKHHTRENIKITVLITCISFTSLALAHKQIPDEGIQDTNTIRKEIIENVIEPCYVAILWRDGGIMQTYKSLNPISNEQNAIERHYLSEFKREAADSTEMIIRAIIPKAKNESSAAERMRVYTKEAQTCIEVFVTTRPPASAPD